MSTTRERTPPPRERNAPDPNEYLIDDPEALTRNMLRFMEVSGETMARFLERPDSNNGAFSAAGEVNDAVKAMSDLAGHWMADPYRLAEAQAALMAGYSEIWSNSMRRMLGDQPDPVMKPEPGDNRFKDPEWSQNAYFDFWKQSYLLTTAWAETMLAGTQGIDETTRKKADFHMRQVSSALSPSNFPMTNPEIMRQTLATNGENLVRGMSNLLTDFQKSGDLLKISQTDIEAFEVGRDLAVTPGKVVYQNELFQLIQYSPTTDKVYETPILITPPWINKFYILDLTPAKSLIRYLVEKGFTVFLISWVNPGEDLAHKTFEDYMTEGILSATEVVRQEANVDKTHVLGYCVGGTLLACTLSYLAAIGEEPYASATFLTAQVDFTSAGDLLMFTDDEQLQSLDEVMEERGFLDGSRMANVFNMLRPRDLIWPYIVNNYMLGKKPFAFDLLFWNQDSTRMAPANHHFYLYEFYNKNRLAAGELKLAGVELDVSKVKTPIYELAAKEDHIAPALSVYKGARMFGGEVTYVLAGSGHIAGVINPPEKFKYQYWLNPRLEETFDDWFMHAREHPGSWWPHWTEWLAGRSGSLEEAREPGARFGVIEDAPGSYVREKG